MQVYPAHWWLLFVPVDFRSPSPSADEGRDWVVPAKDPLNALGAFQAHDKMLHSDRLPVSSFITLQAFTASEDTDKNKVEAIILNVLRHLFNYVAGHHPPPKKYKNFIFVWSFAALAVYNHKYSKFLPRTELSQYFIVSYDSKCPKPYNLGHTSMEKWINSTKTGIRYKERGD